MEVNFEPDTGSAVLASLQVPPVHMPQSWLPALYCYPAPESLLHSFPAMPTSAETCHMKKHQLKAMGKHLTYLNIQMKEGTEGIWLYSIMVSKYRTS